MRASVLSNVKHLAINRSDIKLSSESLCISLSWMMMGVVGGGGWRGGWRDVLVSTFVYPALSVMFGEALLLHCSTTV